MEHAGIRGACCGRGEKTSGATEHEIVLGEDRALVQQGHEAHRKDDRQRL